MADGKVARKLERERETQRLAKKPIKQISLFFARVMELFASVGHFSTRFGYELVSGCRFTLLLVFVWTGSLQLLCPLLNINKNIMPPQWHSRWCYCSSSSSTSSNVSFLAFLFMLQSLPHTRIRTWTRTPWALHFIPLATPHAFLHSTQTIEHLFKQPRLLSIVVVVVIIIILFCIIIVIIIMHSRQRRVNAPKAK